MPVFCPLSTQPVFWNDALQIGAQVSFFNAGTLTPRSCYADGLLTAPLAQPVLTDGNGCIPNIWLQGTNPYKVRIIARTGVQIREVDNLPGDTAGASPPPPPPPGTVTLQTGDLVWAYTTTIIPGRVRANGKTIGNAISGGSEFADPGAQNLFEFLWNSDPTLVVVGGRGLSALNDWNANKAITLPDVNGRTIVGIDGMGSSLTHRLDGITFSKGNPNVLGSTGGSALVTLDVTQIPAHLHTATTQAAGLHQHTGTTDATTQTTTGYTDVQGAHAHSGATTGSGNFAAATSIDYQGNHSHGGQTGGESQSHTHGYSTIPGFSLYATGTQTQGWYGPGTTAQTTGESNGHTHAIAQDGNHTHNIAVTVPNHVHGIISDGAHSHNCVLTSYPHTHTFTSNPAGQHQHTLTTDAMPAALPFDNTQPFILMTAYLVL